MRQSTKLISMIIILLSSTTVSATAQTKTERMADCLVSRTTGGDRVSLIRWIGFSIAGHDAIKNSMAIPEISIDQSDKDIAKLLTRLLVIDCLNETREVVSEGGASAISNAFKVLGEVAMQEVMRDKAVNARIERFANYLNQSDFEKLRR